MLAFKKETFPVDKEKGHKSQRNLYKIFPFNTHFLAYVSPASLFHFHLVENVFFHVKEKEEDKEEEDKDKLLNLPASFSFFTQ